MSDKLKSHNKEQYQVSIINIKPGKGDKGLCKMGEMATCINACKDLKVKYESKDAYHLSELAGQPTNKMHLFLQTKRASYDQTGHPSRAGLVWPEVVLSLAELPYSICELDNMASQFS